MAGIKKEYDVIIIGAGPSGIFCAYELMRRKPDLKVLMLEKGSFTRRPPAFSCRFITSPSFPWRTL